MKAKVIQENIDAVNNTDGSALDGKAGKKINVNEANIKGILDVIGGLDGLSNLISRVIIQDKVIKKLEQKVSILEGEKFPQE